MSLRAWSVTLVSLAFLNIAVKGAVIQPTHSPLHIITLKSGVDPDAVAAEFHLTPQYVYRFALNGFAATVSEAKLESLKSDSRVSLTASDGITVVQETFPMPDYPFIDSGLLRMGVPGFPVPQVDFVDQRIDVDVAVMDTGVDLYHPDLNVLHAVGFIEGSDGYDFNGHGTAMAGIVGAKDNSYGPVGIAPGAKIWAIRVAGQNGQGTWSAFLAGVDYVVQHASEIEIVNASINGYQTNLSTAVAVREAISNAVNQGVVFINSAGNDSVDIYGEDQIFGTLDDVLPAAFPEVLTVSAMDQTNNRIELYSGFSTSVVTNNPVESSGKAIDVAAPGHRIVTIGTAGEGQIVTGASPAAAHVSGLAALYIAVHGRVTNASGVFAIRQAIIDAAQPQSQWGVTNTFDPDGNPEPLAMPSLSWIPPVEITDAKKTVQGFQFNFQTVPGYNYAVQGCSSFGSSNQWSALTTTNGAGSLATVVITDPFTNGAVRYFRVVRSIAP